MRFAVISDVHGNLIAQEVLLTDTLAGSLRTPREASWSAVPSRQ